MSERFFLSEQEIEKRYGKPIAVIRDLWTHSDVYYDAENDQFIEERYHEENLDTGTVCDGCYVMPDGYFWNELVRTCNEEGMASYLKCRNYIPKPYHVGKTVSMEEFLNGLNALMENNPRCRYFCKEIDSVFEITNESKKLLAKVGKADNYYFFLRSDVQKQGFQSLEEALAKALDSITFYHNNRPECDCKVNEVKGYPIGKAYEERFSKKDEKSNSRNRKSLLAKLFRK